MASNIGLDLFSKNLSYFSVPAAFLCALGPHAYAIVRGSSVYDNRDPRSFKEKIAQTQTLDAATKNRIIKADQASANGFETLGYFAASVVAANQAGIEPRTLNALTWGYIATRIAYNISYVHLSESMSLSWVRSTVWQVSVCTVAGIWIATGLKVMNAYVF